MSCIVITANSALVSRGGGMAIVGSSVECLGDVKVSSNAALSGGGIWLSDSTFSGNNFAAVSSNSATDTGGGWFVQGSTLVADTTTTACTASRGGGAYLFNADATFRNVLFDSCTARLTGGGVFASNSKLTATASVVVKNGSAVNGGGIHAVTSIVAGDVLTTNCTATDAGGGLRAEGITSLSGLAVASCQARLGGGIATFNAELSIQSLTVSGSAALEQGGGVYAKDSIASIRDTVFGDHTSESLGGAMMLVSSTAVHRNVTVRNSLAKADGGGVYLSSSSLSPAEGAEGLSVLTANRAGNSGGNFFCAAECTLRGFNIFGGRASYGGGGAFRSGTGALQDVLVVKNNASSSGGGVYLSASSAVHFESVVVSQNDAQISGGGIAIQSSTLRHTELNVTLNSAPKGGGMFVSGVAEIRENTTVGRTSLCFVADNVLTASSGFGAGMYVDAGSQLEASMFEFKGGMASTGGGVYVKSGSLQLSNSAIHNNSAQGSGGGIYIDANSALELINSTVYSNLAYQLGGGIMSSGAPTGALNRVTMERCWVYSNRAVESGGGIALSRTDVNGQSNKISSNIVRNDAGGGLVALTEGTVVMDNWNFVDNTVGVGKAVRGSAMALAGGAKVMVANSNVLSNPHARLAALGGLISVKNAETNVQLVNSTLSDGQAYSGGLIYSEDAYVSVLNCSLLNGWADNFGGGIFTHNSHLEIRDSLLEGNFAYYDGGGILMRSGGSLVMSNVQAHSNVCQDRGGALFVAPGASVTCDIVDSQFTFNRNFGFGSMIFLGRKNSLTMERCEVRNNGDKYNEGGALYAVDATVSIDTTLFESNSAFKGGAIELSRDAVLTLCNTTLRNNSADAWGGAIYTSVRASAALVDVRFESNRATEGGAIFSTGSSVISLTSVDLRANVALNFGGGVSLRGGSRLRADQVVFSSNRGYTGGAIAAAENASLVVTSSSFADNSAEDYGGAIYIDTLTRTSDNYLRCSMAVFGRNNATSGVDIYWVYSQRFSFFECVDSTSTVSTSGKPLASTSATSISAGWWPAAVTSGVSLGVARATNKSLAMTPEDAAIQAVMDNREQSRPGDSVLWPTVVIRDFYGEIASYDNVSSCTAKRVADAAGLGKNESFSFSPSSSLAVRRGYVTFDDAKVYSAFRNEAYTVGITCRLANNLERFTSVHIIVDPCKTGFQNIDGYIDRGSSFRSLMRMQVSQAI